MTPFDKESCAWTIFSVMLFIPYGLQSWQPDDTCFRVTSIFEPGSVAMLVAVTPDAMATKESLPKETLSSDVRR